jgi:CheY-like chemotaxis protein
MNKRVLIVEDEPDIVRGLTDALEFEGFDVTSKGFGKDGVRVMRERGADCVILDLMLPDINGYAVEEIRAFNPLVPIIMRMARGEESTRSAGSTPAPTTTSPSHSPSPSCSRASRRCSGGSAACPSTRRHSRSAPR